MSRIEYGEKRATFSERDNATQASLSAQHFLDNSIDTRRTSSNDASSGILPPLVIEDFSQNHVQSSQNNHQSMESAAHVETHGIDSASQNTLETERQRTQRSEDGDVLIASSDGKSATGDRGESAHGADAGTTDRMIMNGPDGSRVEFDRATGLPMLTVDALGNEYRYRWDSGSDAPSYVSMYGPRTGHQLIEFRENTIVDSVINTATSPYTFAATALGAVIPGSGDNLAIDYFFDSTVPATRYTVSVDGREQPATMNLGAGTGVGVEPVAFNLSICQPIQRNVDLIVRMDGSLQILQPAETVNGTASNRLLTLTNNLDGTTTQEVRTGFILQDTETVHRDRNGRPID